MIAYVPSGRGPVGGLCALACASDGVALDCPAAVGDVVNLNKFRKQKAKAEAAKRAETNRLKHGRTRAERELVERKKHLLDAKLDQSRLEKSETTDSDD